MNFKFKEEIIPKDMSRIEPIGFVEECPIYPPFYHAIKHNKMRRMYNHDYRKPWIYMITMQKNPQLQVFSAIINENSSILNPKTVLYENGFAVNEAINIVKKRYPGIINIWKVCIMPDHVHFIFRILKCTENSLGNYIQEIKRTATQLIPSNFNLPNGEKTPGFTAGFNDLILSGNYQLAKMKRYIDDNPKRYILLRQNSSFFNIGRLWDNERGAELAYYGNPFLMDYPEWDVVRFSRSYSKAEFDERVDRWLRIAANGGVLVSPFIHEQEKMIYRTAIENGGKLIRICDNGFTPRVKPVGSEFYACAEGRLLLIGPNEYKTSQERLNREKCMQMNGIADRLVANKICRI